MSTVLLSSGGLDSAVTAAIHRPDVHLFVNYRQANAIREQWASTAIAVHYGAEKATVYLPVFDGISALTGGPGDLSVPVVPGRNALLLSLGIAYAAGHGVDTVMIGVNASDDDAGFPDCSAAFVDAANNLGAFYGVAVSAPLLDMHKADIGRAAIRHGVPIDITWSCYVGGPASCGSCGACKARREALG